MTNKNHLEIQFTPEDITRKFSEVHKYDSKMKSSFGSADIHAILSPIHRVFLFLSSLNPNQEHHPIELEDITQRAYVHTLNHLGSSIGEEMHFLFSSVYSKKFPLKKAQKAAEGYHKSLTDFISSLPLGKRLSQINSVTRNQRKKSDQVDLQMRFHLYNANRLFSPNFQKDYFILDQECFYSDLEALLVKDRINLTYAAFDPIQTKKDYITYAIAPLIWNVKEHAFNPQNNLEHRRESKHVGVWGNPAKMISQNEGYDVPAPKGDFIITIKDNGFGMQPEIRRRLFRRGTSSKVDEGEGHGIGLYAVKEFVEMNGGKISVKTQLGKGTTVNFTIPYSKVDDYLCVQ